MVAEQSDFPGNTEYIRTQANKKQVVVKVLQEFPSALSLMLINTLRWAAPDEAGSLTKQ